MRDLTAETITEAVIGTMDKTRDPRFKQVLTSLIRHLHAFAHMRARPGPHVGPITTASTVPGV